MALKKQSQYALTTVPVQFTVLTHPPISALCTQHHDALHHDTSTAWKHIWHDNHLTHGATVTSLRRALRSPMHAAAAGHVMAAVPICRGDLDRQPMRMLLRSLPHTHPLFRTHSMPVPLAVFYLIGAPTCQQVGGQGSCLLPG